MNKPLIVTLDAINGDRGATRETCCTLHFSLPDKTSRSLDMRCGDTISLDTSDEIEFLQTELAATRLQLKLREDQFLAVADIFLGNRKI